jgi:hypothetical protein
MHRPNRYSASLFLAATLAISAAVVACSTAPAPAPAQAPTTNVTVNENEHHWDDHENQAWHRFLAENHRPEHEYVKSEKTEQSEYWNWRHSHPD